MRKLVCVLCFLLPGQGIAAPEKGRIKAHEARKQPTKPTAGYHKVWEATLPIAGKRITSPPLRWEGTDTYRVELTGVLDTRRLGARFDAERRSISAKELRVRHDHLRFGSPSWVLVYGHHPRHRYVYGLAAGTKERPGRLRLSFEGVAYYYRISPDKLRRASASTLRVSLWKKGDPPRGGSPVRWDFAAIFAGLGLLGWLIYWLVRRKSAGRAD